MNRSIEFFDRQFRQQPLDAAIKLNPFEEQVLPYLSGDVLDFGCGMGNLAFAAAKQGCRVTALDASPAAVAHIRRRARDEDAAVSVAVADLRAYVLADDYDCVVSVGLLMFFDCEIAFKVLTELLAHVRPGGYAAVNVLVEGTTYLDMFDPDGHCLFAASELQTRFSGWAIVRSEITAFEAPGQTVKRFLTVIARKPTRAKPARP